MLLVNSRVYLAFHLSLHDMINGQAQRNPRQRPHPTGVAIDQSFGVKFGAISIRGAKDNYYIILTDLLDEYFYSFLTLRVKSTGGCSDETLGSYHHRLSASAAYAGFNGRPLDTVTFSDNDYLFPFKFQQFPSFIKYGTSLTKRTSLLRLLSAP